MGNTVTNIDLNLIIKSLPRNYSIKVGVAGDYYIFDTSSDIDHGDWAIKIYEEGNIYVFRSEASKKQKCIPQNIYKIIWSTSLKISEKFDMKWEAIL